MTDTNQNEFSEGSRVRIQSTGHVVTIQKISGHGIAIVEYDFGYRRMVMLNELIKETSERTSTLNVA